MNKRFWIICSVVCLGLLTLSVLGLSSLKMHRKGLQADRQQEFIDVAKQISFDVKKKVDDFLLAEQSRPYTDYQLYYVPDTPGTANNPVALVPSPLVGAFHNGLANGYFQLDSQGRIISPHFLKRKGEDDSLVAQYADYFGNIRHNLLPSLQNGQALATHRIEPTERQRTEADGYRYDRVTVGFSRRSRMPQRAAVPGETEQMSSKQMTKGLEQKQVASKAGANPNRSVYPISSFEDNSGNTQVVTQRRGTYERNFVTNDPDQAEESVSEAIQSFNSSVVQREGQRSQEALQTASEAETLPQKGNPAVGTKTMVPGSLQFWRFVDGKWQLQNSVEGANLMVPDYSQDPRWLFTIQNFNWEDLLKSRPDDTVQVRIEPFVPITVSDSEGENNGIFAGQVYLLRHVQIEDRHLMQGFRLNEDELLRQVAESAKLFLRRGMGYEISKTERPDAAFTAVLQFDFGEIVLNLLEQEPGLVQAQVVRIRNWFFGILGVVWLAVLIAMAALWKNLHEQVVLSRKKDDFISAVSHELRTPLTSIRMYTEMLEKDWVKTDGKRREYYTTMRQESERLTRLVENVLDFSRIQRGKKRYDFSMGDVNACIGEVAEMMRPYVERAGFTLVQDFCETVPFAFDRDAVAQIVINLVDNALKYAKAAEDKCIILRTRQSKEMVLIEIEDHGPGIPRSQQKKIFDAFYRCEDESTRQSVGTGLGLALVKRFAEAHHGFVEILNAKPTGALFRVGLASH